MTTSDQQIHPVTVDHDQPKIDPNAGRQAAGRDCARRAPVGMIWAQTPAGVIGANNTVPWDVPEDFAHFRRTTQGHPVVMGRATWDSLPPRFRPLPGRANIVITGQRDWQQPGAQVALTIEQALELAAATNPEQIWIIGGGQIYAAALAYAQRLLITTIDLDLGPKGADPGSADSASASQDRPNRGRPNLTYAPEWERQQWSLAHADPEQGWHISTTGTRYRIHDWHRRSTPCTPAVIAHPQ